ncbi:NupC/NupG family nucleoside CNT transporter [Sanguibacteroides justesenii]|uniref:NupC/NupG family nucleoside CNT transporter n=2 Tax=Sanguibacteroides justesenii TaxID=1547597 RepID=UPI0009E5B236|nr:nucleoside transporter C-terminal domain-containing protein [Sanguibacteroides justesenii]PXZ43047.1 Na+ dependent nucleoside transporter [Sanguibacteroides justesenii]
MGKIGKITVLTMGLFMLTAGNLFAQAGGGIHSAVNIESHISFMSILRGVIGMVSILGIAWLFSSDRKGVSWRVVAIGLAIQLILAIGILYLPPVQAVFDFVGKIFVTILDFTRAGSEFLLGGLMDTTKSGYIFAFQVLPTIIFFSALTSLLFYLGIIQKVVYGMAWAMTKLMNLTGPESLSVTGNIFLGQTEAPLMVKAYLDDMSPSEIFLVMTGGMATIAGGVLAAYISFLGGEDPVQRLLFAKHLLAASVMAAPGAVVVAKILIPQTQKIQNTIEVPKNKVGKNVLDAISNGASEGVKLAVNVAGMLLVFVAFIAFANYLFAKFGHIVGLNDWIAELTDGKQHELSLQLILGYLFAPLMWLIGICPADIVHAGSLLGQKVIMTEFIAYVDLASLKTAGAFAEMKSVIMCTYFLCGFANFASIGIQIGGIGGLTPKNKPLLAKFGLRALLAGTLASLMSATIIGMIIG